MSDKKMEAKKLTGIVRVSKRDRAKLAGKTNWPLLVAEQKRDSKPGNY